MFICNWVDLFKYTFYSENITISQYYIHTYKSAHVQGPVFNAGGYFQTELQALVCGSFLVSLPSLMLNLFWTLGWSRYRGFSKIGVPLGCLYYFHTKVCSQMTSGGDLYHVGPSKLICETNWWTGPCVMQFLREGYSEQTMILNLCRSGKYTSVLCFSIRGGDTRVPAPSPTWGVNGFLERSLMCWVIIGLGCVSHFGTNEI